MMERGEEGNRNDKDHFIETQIQEVSTNINNFVPTCDLKHVYVDIPDPPGMYCLLSTLKASLHSF